MNSFVSREANQATRGRFLSYRRAAVEARPPAPDDCARGSSGAAAPWDSCCAISRAGAGLRSIAEPVVDTTSEFAELVLAMLGVAAKLEPAHRQAHGAGPGRRQSKGRQIRPQADAHPAPAVGGSRTRRRRRDTAQRYPDRPTLAGLRHHGEKQKRCQNDQVYDTLQHRRPPGS
jgi:hypothetical protein